MNFEMYSGPTTLRIYSNMLHISDWYPTILQMANFENNFDNNDIDGIHQYEALFQDKPELKDIIKRKE